MDKSKLVIFGTAERPLRSSALQQLVQCPMKAVMKFFDELDDDTQAANTGTGMHNAAHIWHKIKDVDESIRQMKLQKGDYPMANLPDAEQMFRYYAVDPRNTKAKIIKIEEEIKIKIKPSKEDKTKEEIVIVGHLDQVREHLDGIWEVFDIKTTKKGGQYALEESLYQMASYCHGASIKFKREVRPGALILPRGYMIKTAGKILSPMGVYYQFSWQFKHIPHILNGLRSIVANIRNGSVHVNPGEYCRWCPAKGIDFCIPQLAKLNGAISLI